MSYCNVDDVIKMTDAKAKNFGLKDKTTEFEELIQEWINQSENFIDTYCHKKWTSETVPLAVKNVCIRLTSNIIAFHYARRDNPIRKVNDYSTTIHSSEVFTDDLRQDLKPFRKPTKISVFTM